MSGAIGSEALEAIVRSEAGLVLASLIARFGSFDLAEDALQDAVATALERWPRDGVPQRPAAWLWVAARRRAIDLLRHESMRARKAETLRADEEQRRDGIARPDEVAMREDSATREEDETVRDERLRLLFTCCHPALTPEARVALTLRSLGGLSTEAVARAFLLPLPTLAKRLERAKRKIRDARIPYRVPPNQEWASRLDSVLAVLYLIFNEGYSATSEEPAARRALCEEAIRLARVLAKLLPAESEVQALLALMLLHDARRDARQGADGALVPLDAQDRRRWRHADLVEGLAALRTAAACAGRGAYQVQAAIAAAHVVAASGAETPWPTIAALYAELESLAPSPVVRVNRAVAEGRAHGAEAALALLEPLAGDAGGGVLASYQPYHAARADLLRRAGRKQEAADAYRAALQLTRAEPERRFLEQQLEQTENGDVCPFPERARKR